jgi:ABC-2 type transport system ATP-binding protein
VLNGISLSFEKGKVYGIIGENGAGKTTLFRCIAHFEDYEGEVACAEHLNLKSVLGFLQTDPFFFAKITGREYLHLLCHARNIPETDFDAQNIFDLPLNQYAETYSTGMKKKLALLAILIQKNEVFILDEPFNGVDIQSNILIKQLILRLKALNKIVIMSSHIFSTLNDTCDELHLLKNGIIVKSAEKAGFDALERDLIGVAIDNKLEKLNL